MKKPRLTVRCLGWWRDASKTERVHEPMILRQGDPGGTITDTCCSRCRDAFVAQLPKRRRAMLDLRLPEPVLRAWMALLRAGIPLPEAARQESLAALRHAFAEDCGCEREPLDSTACGAGEHQWCMGCGCECHRRRRERT